jgi:hypothetical protein
VLLSYCVAHSRYTGSLIGDEIIDGLLFFSAKRVISCYYTITNRTVFVEKLIEVRRTVQELLDQLQASEHDKLPLIYTKLEGSFATFPNGRARETRQSSGPSFLASKARSAWDSTATFALGSTCRGFTAEPQTTGGSSFQALVNRASTRIRTGDLLIMNQHA